MIMAQTSATQTRGALLALTVLAVLLALAARPPACAADPPANSAVTCELDAGYQIEVRQGTTINLADGSALLTAEGSQLSLLGAVAEPITIAAEGSGAYGITINGQIAARYVTFLNLDANGLTVSASGSIDAAANFANCVFDQGTSGGCFLNVANAQDFRSGGLGPINGAYFGTGPACNAAKTSDQGYLQFLDYAGPLAGEDYDNDPYGRVLWGVFTATPAPTSTPTPAATSAVSPTPSPTFLPTSTITPTVVTCIHDGDSNHDSQVTPSDAQLAFMLYINCPSLAPSAETYCSADFCGTGDIAPCDGSVTPADALGIMRRYLSIPDPCAKGSTVWRLQREDRMRISAYGQNSARPTRDSLKIY